MKFTNNTGIQSLALLDALTHDDYDLTKKPDNVWSCTEVIGPPKIAVLKRRHWDELVVDAGDQLWRMMGQAMHHVVEIIVKKQGRERLSEERWVLNVPMAGGEWDVFFLNPGEKIENQKWYSKENYYVSGRMDTYDGVEKSLEDYKFTSAWTFVYGGREEWNYQLNMNRIALNLAGFEVDKLRICGLLRDWDKRKAADGGNYPAGNIIEHPIPIMDDEETKRYIIGRVNLHSSALDFRDSEIPECSPEERWYKPGKYAVMKKGKKRAEKLFDENAQGMADAKAMAAGTPGFYIEPRPGKDGRCSDYCDCNEFCSYYQEHYGKNAVTESSW